MTPQETFRTLQTASKYGGAFMQLLARAAIVADPDNKAKILKTWPEIINTYGPNSALYEKQ